MDLTSQVSTLAEQVHALAASNGALSTRVDGLSSTVGRLSSENVHLSSENVRLSSEVSQLRRDLLDEHLTNIELSKAAAPGGHWVWESAPTASEAAGERGGRWVWSLEKYAPTPVAVVRSGPAAALHSLPVELFRMIFDLLPRSSQIDLGLVCMRLLELSSAVLCDCVGMMQSGDALDFVNYRLPTAYLKSNRIRPLLIPDKIELCGQMPALDAAILSQLVKTSGTPQAFIPIRVLNLIVASADDFDLWIPILACFDPRIFRNNFEGTPSRPPTARPLTRACVDAFSGGWNRLENWFCGGPGSALIVAEEGGGLALGDCLRRAAGVCKAPGRTVVTLLDVSGEGYAERTAPEEHVVKMLRGGSRTAGLEPTEIYMGAWIDLRELPPVRGGTAPTHIRWS